LNCGEETFRVDPALQRRAIRDWADAESARVMASSESNTAKRDGLLGIAEAAAILRFDASN